MQGYMDAGSAGREEGTGKGAALSLPRWQALLARHRVSPRLGTPRLWVLGPPTCTLVLPDPPSE